MHFRRHRNLVVTVVVFLVLITILYISGPKDIDTSWCCVEVRPLQARSASFTNITQGKLSVPPLQPESWVDQGDYLPIRVSYTLLAGTPPTEKKFLTVGLSSVRRKNGSYLLATLRSIFSQSSSAERSSLLVVLLLADFDAQWRASTLGQITAEFSPQLELGQLLVIHAPQRYYPTLTGIKRNFGDAPDRVMFRSKQNVDYSFLLLYSAPWSRFYLMLEDDVDCSHNFLSVIRGHIREQEAKAVAWTTLEFSSLGYIGKLYRSAHLPLLARFLFLFYQEMPCDFLMSHFRVLLVNQREAILFKPSLFQHTGTFSSFRGTHNNLKDKDFQPEPLSHNPHATVFSDIPAYKDHLPGHAYLPTDSHFFWGRAPSSGNHLTVILTNPVVVRGVTVETGSEGKDLLASAVVELGRDPEGEICRTFDPPLGEMGPDGRFEKQDVEEIQGSASSCVRIRVTADQKDWVIIRAIRIRTEERGLGEGGQELEFW
ncbi:alpha-1,3-mannosyl-glycoprotein 4-beta-N-acetylglucosaminyltransferase C-like [Osmerus eperlanus]|uniref:alpha-1,3-mannosyl-glycoprotein 4-beta-N-acetylglucosaminyltransferase C-like n=1 Tax=Osmerus eperlanus TaxID=29151 RepID=UPI002E13940B